MSLRKFLPEIQDLENTQCVGLITMQDLQFDPIHRRRVWSACGFGKWQPWIGSVCGAPWRKGEKKLHLNALLKFDTRTLPNQRSHSNNRRLINNDNSHTQQCLDWLRNVEVLDDRNDFVRIGAKHHMSLDTGGCRYCPPSHWRGILCTVPSRYQTTLRLHGPPGSTVKNNSPNRMAMRPS